MKLLAFFRKQNLGVSIDASKNTMGRPGFSMHEIQYWARYDNCTFMCKSQD